MAINLSTLHPEKNELPEPGRFFGSTTAKKPLRVQNPSEVEAGFERDRSAFYDSGETGEAEAYLGRMFPESISNPEPSRQFYFELLTSGTGLSYDLYNHMAITTNVGETADAAIDAGKEVAASIAIKTGEVSMDMLKKGGEFFIFIAKTIIGDASEQFGMTASTGPADAKEPADFVAFKKQREEQDRRNADKIQQEIQAIHESDRQRFLTARLAAQGTSVQEMAEQQHLNASLNHDALMNEYHISAMEHDAARKRNEQAAGIVNFNDKRKQKQLNMAELQRNEASGAGGKEHATATLNAG